MERIAGYVFAPPASPRAAYQPHTLLLPSTIGNLISQTRVAGRGLEGSTVSTILMLSGSLRASWSWRAQNSLKSSGRGRSGLNADVSASWSSIRKSRAAAVILIPNDGFTCHFLVFLINFLKQAAPRVPVRNGTMELDDG